MTIDKKELLRFTLQNAKRPVSGLGSLIASHFGVSRQAVSKFLSTLREKGWLRSSGRGRSTVWEVGTLKCETWTLPLQNLYENDVWRSTVSTLVGDLPDNVRKILHHGFTEILNNAIDHSQGKNAKVLYTRTPLNTTISIADDGEGIFRRIQRILGLYDARAAILELSKGKLTTDPERHSGEGIFFTSRMFDEFCVLSYDLFFAHRSEKNDWLIEASQGFDGTRVWMTIANDSVKTVKEVFDEFAQPDDYSFSKTIVPVRLAAHEGENLVSRSQAKRLIMRFERFKMVMLDFDGVEEIGQAFADEVFRVFKTSHPSIELGVCNAKEPVLNMIKRIEAAKLLSN